MSAAAADPPPDLRGPRRVAMCGDDLDTASAALEAAGHEVVTRNPEWILCHGGDGTLLRAEREWPGLPKLPVRVAERVQPCAQHTLPAVLTRLGAGELQHETLGLLAVAVGRVVTHALNDVVVRNESPGTAVRLAVIVDGRASGEVTGDGVVVATPFGSSGYFRSITGSQVPSGLALAWNNPTEPRPPQQLREDAQVEIVVLRGPALLVHDNDPRQLTLREGHRVLLRRSPRSTQAIGLDALRCQVCRKADGSRFNPH